MGEQFGAYEIERRLGAGGMAEVFLARRKGPEGFSKRVALKRVLPAFNEDREFVRLFQDEARLAAHLDHPHIASLHDFGEVEGTWFMAMELVDGIDLRTLLNGLKKVGQPLPSDLALLIAVDLASALIYAHELEIDGKRVGLVHRDISPSNVLLSVDGAVKLADFGIARAATHGHHTRTGIVKGKVPYMPPEQALGERVDQRADLFALGVLLFESIAGKRPYEGVTELDTLQRVCKGQHPLLSELAPHVPPLLADVVHRLIRSSLEDRLASAGEVLDALAASPPPTNARRLLGNLVRRVREAERAGSSAAIAPLRQRTPTASATPPKGARAETRLARGPGAAERDEHEGREPANQDPPEREGALAQRTPEKERLEHESTREPERDPRPEPERTVRRPRDRDATRDARRPLPVELRPAGSTTRWLVPVLLAGALVGAVVLAGGVGLAIIQAASPSGPRAEPGPVEPEPAPAEVVSSVVPIVIPIVSTAPTATEEVDAGSEQAAPAPLTDELRSPRDEREARGAQLSVYVIPFGEVEIDGRALGPAPVHLTLSPGLHRVRASHFGREARRAVRLEAGQREDLLIQLAEE